MFVQYNKIVEKNVTRKVEPEPSVYHGRRKLPAGDNVIIGIVCISPPARVRPFGRIAMGGGIPFQRVPSS